MALFGQQLRALLIKDLKIARNNKKSTLAEILFPLFMGVMTGFFIHLVSTINSGGDEYSDNNPLIPLGGNASFHRWVGYGPAPAGSIMETFLGQLKTHAPASTQYVSLADTTPAGVQEAYDVQYMTWFQFAATNVFAAVVSVAGRTMPTIYGPTFGAPDNTAGTFAALANQLSDIAYPASVNQVGLNYQYLDMTVNLRAIFSSTGMVLLIYAFIPAIIVTAGRLVEDKRVKARETLKVMGCSDTAYLLANAIGATLRMAVGVALISVILAAFGAIPGSDIPVVMGISVMFAWTLIAYAQITPAVTSTPIWANVMCIVLLAGGAVLSGLSTGWSKPLQMLMCLISPIAYFYGVLPSLSNGSVDLLVSPGEACIMLVVDVVLYVIVGNYIYAINPGEYGVPKHPLFFIRWIWVKKEQVRNVDVTVKSLNQSENDRVVLQNLSKYFGSQRDTPSVDNLSITIRRGEIYALLGHNGAGKTTTMSILTGMITPTSYDVASVDGYDIHEDMDRIRQTVGLCPQFDVLFGDLSARDHLLMFAGIKGVQNAEALVQTLLDDLELPVTNQRADTFSGGMKRRLSVGNAIVGGATLLFLDEPSSGMDPLSRRQMWDLLKRQREMGKTIVLTTHFMEEADYLGDRIAIMVKGHLYCCETSSALKQKYGTGFKLVVAKKDPSVAVNKIERLLCSHVEGVKAISEGHGDAAFELPAAQLPKFAGLLRELEAHKEELGVSSYGVQMNTLEDVFVDINHKEEMRIARVRAEKAGEVYDEYGATNHSLAAADDEVLTHVSGRTMEGWMTEANAVTDFARLRSQIWLVFTRKWTMFKRSMRMRLMIIGFPIFFLFFAFIAIQPQNVSGSTEAFLERDAVDVTNFNFAVVSMRDDPANNVLVGEFMSVFEQTYNNTPRALRAGSYSDYMSGVYLPVKSVSFITGFNSPDVTGGLLLHHNTLLSGQKVLNVTVLWNRKYDVAFLASMVNMVRAAAHRIANDKTAVIQVANAVNFQLPKIAANYTGAANVNVKVTKKYNVMQIGMYMVLSIGQVVATCAIPMGDEITRNVYHTSMAQGMSPLAYFVGNICFDLLTCIWPFVLFILGVMWRDVSSYYSGALVLCIFAGMLYCTHALLQAYIFVSYLQGFKPYVYTAMIHLANLATMGAPYLIDVILKSANVSAEPDIKPYLLSLFPSCSWYHIIDNTSDFDEDKSSASAIFTFTGIRTGWGFIFLIVELIVPIAMLYCFARNSGIFLIVSRFRERALAKGTLAQDGDRPASPKSAANSPVHSPKAGRSSDEMTSALITPTGVSSNVEDVDVTAERQRVEGSAPQSTTDMVYMRHLRKQYGGGKVALKDLSLGIPVGECFGLLGPNGAGKSTACKLILSQLAPTSGEIGFPYANVTSNSSQADVFRYARLGVCQQTDTLWEFLSAEEHMEQFLRLRLTSLYDREAWRPYITRTLQRIKLDDADGKAAGGYSGGMKRKLQVCLAMYTGAKSVFLDEPSTGMDPFARRALWKVILDACSNDACVVLTTHSMDEAEAVCGRIGIITQGALRCIGTTQHLKTRFGSGYVITVCFQPGMATPANTQGMRETCRREFGNSFLVKEELGTLHRYGVDTVSSLAEAFSFLEQHAKEFHVEQYSVTQTASLEEIFLGFVTSTRDD
jgi:ATP-binding cassette subfamily A (ABC1) protein 3